MEVEVSCEYLDCSGDWMVAMVANDSHVVLLSVETRRNWPRHCSLIIPYATRFPSAKNANLLNDLNKRKAECGALIEAEGCELIQDERSI
jgi:hypothetical protein